MNLSQNAQAALNSVVEKFQTGDLSPIVQVARMQRTGGPIPSDRWTLSNRVLAFCQTGSWDCRGFRQWQKVGRHVVGGAKAAFIFGPVLVPQCDPDTGAEIQVLTGFKPIAVFADHQTIGSELPGNGYAPREMPPLADVAERMGIDVRYQPLPSDRWGQCSTDGRSIRLGTHDPRTWFHELAHSIHAKIDGGLQGGQHQQQEIIAEFTACVLAQLYGYDYTGNAWNYISHYASDPLMALSKALGKVEQVLALLLEDTGTCHAESPENW
jgi:hypothetical protein